MANGMMVLFGMGPVQRAISARLRSRIHDAEAKLVEQYNALDLNLEESIRALRESTKGNKSVALDIIVGDLLR